MENIKRKKNSFCFVCASPTYQRPGETAKGRKSFCCRDCWKKYKLDLKYEDDRASIIKHIDCMVCGKDFKPCKSTSKYCSRTCSNYGRAGITYNKSNQQKYNNTTQQRLSILQQTFNVCSCMIDGCQYNKLFEIHRHIPGKLGGKYEIGNMFAICPNHHAEITRKLIEVEKVNDYTLRIVNNKYESYT